MKIVSDRVGHAGTDVTTRVYGHRSKGRDRGAAEQIAALFFGSDWQLPDSFGQADDHQAGTVLGGSS